jgi:hypothetical protein
MSLSKVKVLHIELILPPTRPTPRPTPRTIQKTPEQILEEKVAQTYEHIVQNWGAQEYRASKQGWDNVKQDILPGNARSRYKCAGCNTKWSVKSRICYSAGVCCNCDTYCQPCLSNPINRTNVLRYIPEQYHCDILED